MKDNIISEVKTCPQCGKSFTCTPSACWCSALPPVMPVNASAECYCPTCLTKIINLTIEKEHKQNKI